MLIDNKDFKAWRVPNPNGGYKWNFTWEWETVPTMKESTTSLYNKSWFTDETGVAFDREVQQWLEQGVLVPLAPGEAAGNLLPWSLVEQNTRS
jgi:hypothetical protein